MKPLQTQFDSLIAPEFLTQELAFLLIAMFFGMLYASLKLRSLLGLFGWMIMTVALMITIFTNLPLIWFWLAVVVESFILVLAHIEYTRAAARD